MTAPAHSDEHNGLMQIIGKLVNQSELIDIAILVTVGTDGRPAVGGNLDNPAQITEVLRQIVAAEDQVATITQVDLPRDN